MEGPAIDTPRKWSDLADAIDETRRTFWYSLVPKLVLSFAGTCGLLYVTFRLRLWVLFVFAVVLVLYSVSLTYDAIKNYRDLRAIRRVVRDYRDSRAAERRRAQLAAVAEPNPQKDELN